MPPDREMVPVLRQGKELGVRVVRHQAGGQFEFGAVPASPF
jgi:hypothetical protein